MFFFIGSRFSSRISGILVLHELIAMHTVSIIQLRFQKVFFIQQVLKNSSISKNIIQVPSFSLWLSSSASKIVKSAQICLSHSLEHNFSLVKPSLDRHPISHRAMEDPTEPLTGTVEDLPLRPEDSI